MSRSPLHVFAIRHKDGTIRSWVSIITGDHTYPGGPHAIRIDQHAPHTTTDIEDASWNSAESKRILAQLIQGHTARTRLISWPYRSAVDHEIPLDGFPAAWQALQRAVRQP